MPLWHYCSKVGPFHIFVFVLVLVAIFIHVFVFALVVSVPWLSVLGVNGFLVAVPFIVRPRFNR
jgi:hypothetical protein